MEPADEVEPADAAALIRAYIAQDAETIESLLSLLDPQEMLGVTLSFLLGLLGSVGVDPDEVARRVEAWQTHRLS